MPEIKWLPIPMLTLPTIYSDELSYYEQLLQIVNHINTLAESINGLGEKILNETKTYVDIVLNQNNEIWNDKFNTQQLAINTQLIDMRNILNTELSELQKTIDKEILDTQNSTTTQINNLRNEITQDYIVFSQKVVTLSNQVFELHTSFNNLYNDFGTFEQNIENQIIELEKQLEKYIDNALPNKLPKIINPFTGKLDSIQNIFLFIACEWNPNGLTAREYERLKLTAQEYDNMRITAGDYIQRGKWIFFERLYVSMRNPFNGEIVPQRTVIQNLVDFHSNTLTASEYDALDITAENYDNMNLTAYEYDWNGKDIL